MKLLFLFYTQAEGGASGFLSRRGEEAAGILAQTVFQFAHQTLGVDLEAGFDVRARSLEEDLRWKAFRGPASLPQAVRAAHVLFSDILMVSGEHFRTLKTAEPVAEMCGLPVCVDARLDKSSDDKPAGGILRDAVSDLIANHLCKLSPQPRCVLIATSQKALVEWLQPHMSREQWSDCQGVLSQSTQNDTNPAVFACGCETSDDGVVRWIIE